MDSAQPIAMGQLALRLPAVRREGHYQPQAMASDSMAPVDTVTIENAVPATNAFEEIEFSLGSRMAHENLPPSLASLLEEIKRHLEEAMKKARETRPDFFERLAEMRGKLEDAETAERLEMAGSLMAATSPEFLDQFSKALADVMADAQSKDAGDASASASVKVSPIKLALNFDHKVSVVVDELHVTSGHAASGGKALRVSGGKIA